MGENFVMRKSTFWALIAVCLTTCLLVGLLAGLLPNKNTVCEIKEPQIGSTEPVPTTIPTTEPMLWENIRLPTSVKPHHYDLYFHIDLTGFVFNGKSVALIECTKATNIILIHSKELNIDTGLITLTKKDGGSAPGFAKDPWLYPENQYLVIELEDYLKIGAMYELSIDFDAALENSLIGLYRSSYKESDGNTVWLATTFFAPTDARKAFPCFDEPAYKANFTLTIDHQPQYLALANMPLDGPNTTLDDGWIRAKFQMSVPMSTYLVCFVVCDFVFEQKVTKNNVTLRGWARKEAKSSIRYSVERGADIIDYFDEYFGIPFPLPKMDMIAIPDFAAGAMENWGLITYRETALLYEEGVSSPGNKQRVCTVVSHELAHQWFGNLVTLQWWDDTWLNEGFASYVEYLGVDEVEPTWGMTDQFVVLDPQRVMNDDALWTSRPIIVDVQTTDEINQQFDSISYSKGASILRMLQNFLGETTFRKGLKTYLTEFAYSNAVNTDLWRHLSDAAQADGKDIDVETIMNTWTLQMGYPSVNITRDDATTISATQERFLLNPESAPDTPYGDVGYKWYVPISFTAKNDPTFENNPIVWLNPDETFSAQTTGASMDDWVLANINEYGYYRVNYDLANWEKLIQQLIDEHTVISVTSRSALISDAFNLARSGSLSQVTAFELTAYLVNETNYVPWVSVDSNLGYVDLMLSRSAAYGNFQTYMLRQVTPFYEYIGWEGGSTNHLDRLSHSLAVRLACSYGNVECGTKAVDEFSAWMADPSTNNINPTLRSTVYCAAIAAGDQEQWFFAYEQYNSTSVASEASTLLGSLSCSKSVWILSTLLDYTLDENKIRSQDAVSVVVNVAHNTVGYSLAWDFFRANWDFFLTRDYGSSIFKFTDLIEGVTDHFNTEFELNMLEEFMVQHPDQGTASRAFIQAVDKTKANIRWVDSYLDEVQEWLEQAAN